MEARLLGSGGWLPTDRRETACVYIRDGADVLVLDAGTGFRRLATEPALLEGVERLHVALTHFHLDHTYGLMALPAVARRVASREVWAPGRLVARATAEEMIHRLLGPPFLAGDEGDVAGKLATRVHELERDTEIGPFRVQVRVQPFHTGPTLAVKVNGELAYCTDTAWDDGNIEFARGARVLLHEAFWAADTSDDRQHSASGEAARIASGAGVDHLVLIHINPLLDDDEALLGFAIAHFAATDVGTDGFSLA